MSKRTSLLIILLAFITALLVFTALRQQNITPLSQITTENVLPTRKPTVEKTATVYFSPSFLDTSTASTPYSIDVMVDSSNTFINGVQIELAFDPKAIRNVALVPSVQSSSFFGTSTEHLVLFRELDQVNGRASFAIATKPNDQPKKGIGKIATLTFQVVKPTTQSTTQITFIPKTMVTKEGVYESVLKETVPLTISLSTSTNPTQ